MNNEVVSLDLNIRPYYDLPNCDHVKAYKKTALHPKLWLKGKERGKGKPV
jgi:hypothetical protein